MLKGSFKRENKFFVLKWADVTKYLNDQEKAHLENIAASIGRGREHDGKKQFNDYVVCNQDEPYADLVWGIIEEGENKKNVARIAKEINDATKDFHTNNGFFSR